MTAELVDALQGDDFLHIVLKHYQKIRGRPLTKLEYRQKLADLRNGVSVRPTDPTRFPGSN